MFDIFRRNLSLERSSGSYDEDGIWVNEAPIVSVIKASVQASDAEILQTLPEGYRTKEVYTLFTDEKLRIAEVDKHLADIIVIDNIRYQVVKVTPWQNLDFDTKHYEVVVVKMDDDNVND